MVSKVLMTEASMSGMTNRSYVEHHLVLFPVRSRSSLNPGYILGGGAVPILSSPGKREINQTKHLYILIFYCIKIEAKRRKVEAGIAGPENACDTRMDGVRIILLTEAGEAVNQVTIAGGFVVLTCSA